MCIVGVLCILKVVVVCKVSMLYMKYMHMYSYITLVMAVCVTEQDAKWFPIVLSTCKLLCSCWFNLGLQCREGLCIFSLYQCDSIMFKDQKKINSHIALF